MPDDSPGSRRKPAPLSHYRLDEAHAGLSLADYDPGAKPCSSGDKAADKAAVEALAQELDGLQNLFYADRRYKLLVVLQGLDTSGKDGTLRGVFGRMSPLGVRAVGWKAPSAEERDHDYLWRIHRQVPAAGEIVVFNRSHYEDVLVPVVEGWIDARQTAQRYAQIRDFERLLAETGTVILKCMLHISKEEQAVRLQERVDDPAKRWKFNPGDLDDRALWDDYMKAYEEALIRCSTPQAPWHVIPADRNWVRNGIIARIVRQTLEEMNPELPQAKGWDPATIKIT